LYATVKAVSYAAIEFPYLHLAFHRIWLGAIMVILLFALTASTRLSRRWLSVLTPMSLIVLELPFVLIIGGDRLTYLFLIGVPLLSLLYMSIKGFLIVMLSIVATVVFVLFVMDMRFIGDNYSLGDEIFNFVGIAVIYVIYFLLSRYTIGAILSARKAAEDATRSKSEFVATVSHEIRTPLNTILGLSQIQIEKEGLSDASYAGKIYNSGKNLLALINDLLDISKIETGGMAINPAKYQSQGLISDATQLCLVRIGNKPIEFMLDIHADFPREIIGDEVRVKQILSNLLTNAVKYTESGQIKLIVRHTLCENSLNLIFTVEDSGQGMKPEDLAKMFTRYTRFNTKMNRKTEGTGLGLTITKRLIELMEGEIRVESEYGKGSKFTVTIKQAATENEAIGEKIADSLRSFSATNTSVSRLKTSKFPHKKVLVVDDVDLNLYVAQEMLRFFEIEAEITESGREVIQKVQNGEAFDIIFIDHLMPEMDGVEVAQRLRQMGYKGTLIALSANAMVGNDEMFLQNGFNHFLAKPIDVLCLGEILKCVSEVGDDKFNHVREEL
jgi:signal transduction histidine kinase/ActR/RegA family two-component response regulator